MLNNKKKLLLGSALAGMMVAGPSLAVTANSNATQGFFQTAELKVGYRLAQAEDTTKKAAEGDTTKDGTKKCSADKKCSGDKKCSADKKCGPDKKCGADKKCGEGKCGGDKKSDGEKKCSAGKTETKSDTTK